MRWCLLVQQNWIPSYLTGLRLVLIFFAPCPKYDTNLCAWRRVSTDPEL